MTEGEQARQEIKRRLEIYDALVKHKWIIQEALSEMAEQGQPHEVIQAQNALYDLIDIW